MGYSHQKNHLFFYFFIYHSLFPQGQFKYRMVQSLFACSLFMLHYRIHFKGTIVASKPIKPLWLVSGFQRIIGHDWPLPLILHLQFHIDHHRSCSTKLDLVWSWFPTLLRYHRKALTQVSSVVNPDVNVNPVFLVSSSYTRLVMSRWKELLWGGKKWPHLMGLQGFYCSTKHKDTMKPTGLQCLPWVNTYECV